MPVHVLRAAAATAGALLLLVLAAALPAAATAKPRAGATTVAAHQSPVPDDGSWGEDWEDDWVDLDGDGWPDPNEWTDGSGFDGTDTGVPATGAAPVPTVTPTPVVTPVPTTVTKPRWPSTPAVPEVPLVTTATVKGKVAMLRKGGKAAIPRGAPLRVRRVIAAANRIVGKPYKWGGGHALLEDRGYDCSGTVSYALIRSQLLGSPMVSGTFAKWARAGEGQWITIYANKGHVYMEVAGLRLDTSPMGDPRGGSGPRWRPVIGKRQGFHVRHLAGM